MTPRAVAHRAGEGAVRNLHRAGARDCAARRRHRAHHRKYARRQGWVPRLTRLSGDGTAAGLSVRGAGGRFVPQAEAGKPHARGLKALDPAGSVRAAAACIRAGELSDYAVAQPARRSGARPVPGWNATRPRTGVRSNC